VCSLKKNSEKNKKISETTPAHLFIERDYSFGRPGRVIRFQRSIYPP